MRKQLLAVVLSLLVLRGVAEAQTPSPAGQAALQRVDVIRDGDSIRVEIAGRGPWRPKVATLDSPPRVVVGLADTAMSTSHSHIDVDSQYVKAVRIGTDGQPPPTTRVVIDCLEKCRYELLPGSGDKVILRLYAGSAPAQAIAARNEAPARGPTSEKPRESTAAPLV